MQQMPVMKAFLEKRYNTKQNDLFHVDDLFEMCFMQAQEGDFGAINALKIMAIPKNLTGRKFNI